MLEESAILSDSTVREELHNECAIQHDPSKCQQKLRPVKDAMYVLSGKWKIPIIISLSFGPRRFKQIATDLEGITDKVLSKELKELEQNELLEREVFNSFPPRVEYRATEYAKSLHHVISALREWGTGHREKIMKKKPPKEITG
ncbi:MAG: transcriptional regulator [Chitinophagaceae bacterium]|nr:MAG: transcriptional regulator [Chitinophagaceae bacterium]